jgi:putative NADPH-quinone reductase
MKISVILAHPNKGSLNSAIADTTCQALRSLGHEVWFHDLYQEHFDPVLPAMELPSAAPLGDPLKSYCQ